MMIIKWQSSRGAQQGHGAGILPTAALALLTGTGFFFASAQAEAQTFRIGMEDETDVLDPHKSGTFAGRIIFASLCDKLIDIDGDLNFTPRLATSWSWNADNTELTLALRQGVTFHDGTPFNAAAVAANLERAKTLPDSLRKSEISFLEEVDQVDEHTVVLRMAQPNVTMLAQLADRAGMMMSPTALAGGVKMDSNPVCSGPYKFGSWVVNDRLILDKFAGHWDATAYSFDQIQFVTMTDQTVRLANLRSGDLDMMEGVSPTDVPAVKADPDLQFSLGSGLGYDGIVINVGAGTGERGPLNSDKRVRQALQLAIDKEVLNQVVGGGIWPAAQQPFPMTSPFHSEKFPPLKRDVDAAKALLKESGYERVAFKFVSDNGPRSQQVAQLVQAMAGEAGFDVSIQVMEVNALLQAYRQGDFDVGYLGWSGRVDPDANIHQFVTCEGSRNDGKYCNPEVDRLLNLARTIADPAERKQVYDDAQVILQDELPWIYTNYIPRPFALASDVKGFVAFPDGIIRLSGVTSQ